MLDGLSPSHSDGHAACSAGLVKTGAIPFIVYAGPRALLRFATTVLLGVSVAIASAAGLRITSPAPKETIHDNAGDVKVVLSVEDGAVLPPGYRIRLLLDGEPAVPDGSGTRLQLSGIDRGTHQLQALIVDDNGRVLTRSEPVTFYMWQASRLNRRGP